MVNFDLVKTFNEKVSDSNVELTALVAKYIGDLTSANMYLACTLLFFVVFLGSGTNL